MFKVKRLKLTKDQKERGVVFSSQLDNYTLHDVGLVHEVFEGEPDADEHIKRLKDVSFFRNWANDAGFDCVLIERS